MKLVISVIAGALLSGSAVYLWQSTEVDQLNAELEAARASESATVQHDAEVSAELKDLTDQLAKLRARLNRATIGQADPNIAPPVATLDDGRHFGFIKTVQIDQLPPSFVVDLAEFLSGPEAQAAAENAGFVEEGDPVPNDYFISNVNPLLRQLEMKASVTITLSTWDRQNIPDPKAVDLATFERIFRAPKQWELSVLRNGYWITVEDGRVVDLEEQYVP